MDKKPSLLLLLYSHIDKEIEREVRHSSASRNYVMNSWSLGSSVRMYLYVVSLKGYGNFT